MKEDEFRKLLDDYLDPPGEPNPRMTGVEIVWVRDRPEFGSMKMAEKHNVTEREVEEVLFEIPPFVAAKRSPAAPGRTLFWGATRHDRWLIVVCEDWTEGDLRYLKPITAFEPDDGEEYWRRL